MPLTEIAALPPTEHPSKPPSGQRRQLAEAAAKLLAEGLAASVDEAVKSAARDFALRSPDGLPTAVDVQNALAERQRLFEPAHTPSTLSRWRKAAEDAMEALTAFSPRIAGAVWEGALTSHSEITLHLHCDRPEHVEHWLTHQGIPGTRGQRRIWLNAHQASALPTWEFFAGDYAITLCVLPESALRQPPLNAADKRPMSRGSLAGLRRLIASDPARHE